MVGGLIYCVVDLWICQLALSGSANVPVVLQRHYRAVQDLQPVHTYSCPSTSPPDRSTPALVRCLCIEFYYDPTTLDLFGRQHINTVRFDGDILAPVHNLSWGISFLLSAYIKFVSDTVDRFMCISGVHRLTSLSSALTLNFILNLRKFSSLLISVLYFENGFGFEMAVGSSFVLLGTVMYSLSSSSSAAKKPNGTTTRTTTTTTTIVTTKGTIGTSKSASTGVAGEAEAPLDSKRQ